MAAGLKGDSHGRAGLDGLVQVKQRLAVDQDNKAMRFKKGQDAFHRIRLAALVWIYGLVSAGDEKWGPGTRGK